MSPTERDSGRGTFLLGVGCQKGGTSWLYEYLAASPEVAAGFAKEYHVFDGLDVADCAPVRAKLMGRARQAARSLEAGEEADANALLLASFYASLENYVDYFESLLVRSGPVRLAMDITPAYAMLSATRFALVREAFERRGIRIRVVFLLRDPVERLWSSLRMHHRRGGKDESGVEARVLKAYPRPYHEGRSRFDRTMAALDEAFAPDQLHYALYEELFRLDAVHGLCRFLGIEAHEPDLEARVNASPKTQPLGQNAIRTVAQHYAPAYDAARDRFGEATLRELWPSYPASRPG